MAETDATLAPEELVETATAYPFAAADRSMLFVDGACLPIVALDGPAIENARVETAEGVVPARTILTAQGISAPTPMDARVAVLAYGANSAPQRLALKFAPLGPGVVFPILRAQLRDFDVVYAAHISSYGAVPATIERSPGTVAEIAVTYLDARQLARMHETEFSRRTYLFGRLGQASLSVDLAAPPDAVHSYVGGFGHIAPDGTPFALAAIAAQYRRFPALSQREMHQTVRALLAGDAPLDRYIHAAIADETIRRARTEALRARARPFSHPDFTVLAS